MALSPAAQGHVLHVAFDLSSDGGLELGGWAIDDLCVVANVNSICGDGVVSLTEQCDDGEANADRPGARRTFCKLPTCGDRIVDEGEDCDRGFEGDPTCTPMCVSVELPPAGCCSATGGRGAIALGALVALSLIRPRRRAKTN